MNFKFATFYSFSRTLWNHYATLRINISLEEMCNCGDLIYLLLLFFGFVIVSCCSVDFFPCPCWFLCLLTAAAHPDLIFAHQLCCYKRRVIPPLIARWLKTLCWYVVALLSSEQVLLCFVFLSCSLALPLFLSSSSALLCAVSLRVSAAPASPLWFLCNPPVWTHRFPFVIFSDFLHVFAKQTSVWSLPAFWGFAKISHDITKFFNLLIGFLDRCVKKYQNFCQLCCNLCGQTSGDRNLAQASAALNQKCWFPNL